MKNATQISGFATILDDIAKSLVVLDRELDEEKSKGPTDPRICCPLCCWSPRKEDRWSCDCGHEWNTFDSGRRLPRLPTPVGFNPVSVVQPLVATFGLVCTFVNS